MTRKVYVSGPMTGYVDWNRDAFFRAAEHLRCKGYDVVNPAELDAGMSDAELAETPHAFFLRRDIRALLDCDLIYLLPGWRYSKGATLEKAVAEGCGIDRLLDSDVDTWRSFEGEPDIRTLPLDEAEEVDVDPIDHTLCEPVEGDGYGNEWCSHGGRVSSARGLHSVPQPGDSFPNVAYVRDMTGRSAAELAEGVRRLARMGFSSERFVRGEN